MRLAVPVPSSPARHAFTPGSSHSSASPPEQDPPVELPHFLFSRDLSTNEVALFPSASQLAPDGGASFFKDIVPTTYLNLSEWVALPG